MAADFISVDRTKQHGNSTVRAAGLLQETTNLIEDLEANAQRMWETDNYVTLEAKFGLQAGAGPNFLTLLGTVKAQLNDATLVEFVSRVAGQ